VEDVVNAALRLRVNSKKSAKPKTSATKPTDVAGLPFQIASNSTESASGAPLISCEQRDIDSAMPMLAPSNLV